MNIKIKQIEIMATLTQDFIKNNKVDGKFQMIVNYGGAEMIIHNITDKNIMLKQASKENRGNCGRFNTGRYRIANNESSTEWYLNNRIIK